MKKFFFLILFVPLYLFACATCQLMVPTAHVDVTLNLEDKHLAKSTVSWHFSDLYTQEITKQYDKNRNSVLDPKELDVILNAKLDYLRPKQMLLALKVGSQQENFSEYELQAKFSDFALEVLDQKLLFRFSFESELTIEEGLVLSMKFEDDENFFSFILQDVAINTQTFYYSLNNYLYTTAILFSNKTIFQENNQSQAKQIQADLTKQRSAQQNLLEQSIQKIKALFEEIKTDANPLAYSLLLFFAFAYGVIHALGPGHGKTLVASYFLSNERSYLKALYISLAIGVVHTFSAFLLTLVVYFVVTSFLAQFIDDTIFYTTKISALLIIAIAVYLFYKKLKAIRIVKKTEHSFSFSTTPHQASCGCAACKDDHNTTDLALILSAGIIPCPGTITLFIFALSLELYLLGFLSAFSMSLGMSFIIFISALISTAVRKKTIQTNTTIKLVLEYISLSIILLLGIFLLF